MKPPPDPLRSCPPEGGQFLRNGRAELTWIEAERAPSPAPLPAPDAPLPPPPLLRALQDAVSLGHVRGIGRPLDAIEAADASYAAFAERLRLLARRFQYGAVDDLLKKALDEALDAPDAA